jgi:hypothetical protein
VALSQPGNDDVERLFHRLVEVLADGAPGSLSQAITVGDLYQRVIPYRAHRVDLHFDSHQDYEMALLRLLSGERGLAALEADDVREALEREVGSVNPDPGLFRAYPDARVRLNRNAVDAVLGATDAYAPPTAGDPAPPPNHGGACPQCDAPLPTGRTVLFCPYCGANAWARECSGCGAAMDLDWMFCVTCGKRA